MTLDDLARDPHPVHARLRDLEPVCRLPVLDGWLVTSHELVRRVLADPAVFTVDDPRFSTARVVGPSMLSLDGAAHRRHRRPFAVGFRRADARSAQRRLVSEVAARLVESVADRGSAEVRTEIAGPLAATVMAAVLGLPDAGSERLAQWYRAIVASVSGISAGQEPTSAGAAAFGELSAAVLAAVAGPAADVDTDAEAGSVLAPLRDDPGLTRDEIASNAAVVMFGGIETTEAITTTAVLHLLSHPGWLRAVREEPALAERAVQESLRLEPAAARVDRYAVVDTVLGGREIARGELVIASLAAANRDPAVWPDPDRYDLDRASGGDHLAFAHGPHACLAADLARWQAIAVLRELLRLPDLRLSPEHRDDPRGLVFRKPDRVDVIWETA